MNQGIQVQESPREIRSLARFAMNGVLGKLFVFYFIYQCAVSFIPGFVAQFIPALSYTYSIDYMGTPASFTYSFLPVGFLLLLNGPFRMSLSKIYLRAVRERRVENKDFALGFKHFIKAFLTWLLMMLSVALGMIPIAFVTALISTLLMRAGGFLQGLGAGLVSIGMIVSMCLGLIVYFFLALSFYVLSDNPSLKPIGALKTSIGIMRPNLFRLIILRLSYVFWIILGLMLSYSISGALGMVIPENSIFVTIISSLPMMFVSIYMDLGESFFYEFATGHLKKASSEPSINRTTPNRFGY